MWANDKKKKKRNTRLKRYMALSQPSPMEELQANKITSFQLNPSTYFTVFFFYLYSNDLLQTFSIIKKNNGEQDKAKLSENRKEHRGHWHRSNNFSKTFFLLPFTKARSFFFMFRLST